MNIFTTVNNAVAYVATVILLAITVFVYVFLVSCVYPRVLRSTRSLPRTPQDRGVKKYKFQEGRAVVYETGAALGEYISQYVLSVSDGIKQLRCKLSPSVVALQYDVIVFDSHDRYVSSIAVTEMPIKDPQFSRPVILPPQTAYVNIVLRRVNNLKFPSAAPDRMIVRRMAIFTALTVISTMAEVALIKSYVLHLVDWQFSYVATVGSRDGFYTVTSSLWMGLLISALILWMCYPDVVKAIFSKRTVRLIWEKGKELFDRLMSKLSQLSK